MLFPIKKRELYDSFELLNSQIIGYSILSKEKRRSLYEFAIMSSFLSGNVAEAGVYKGGIVYLLASVLQNKVIHGFDSWEGSPKLDPEKDDQTGSMKEGGGKCNMPVEYLSKFGNRVVLHKGWIENTLTEVDNEQFCLVHIDCDFYSSIKQCLEFFVPRLVSGGFIICDDYGFPLCPGATQAVDEFMINNNRPYIYFRFDHLILRFD